MIRLDNYDYLRKKRIESREYDAVVRDYASVMNFIKDSITSPHPSRRIHIGIISNKTADLVLHNTEVDIHNYDVVLSSDNIAHMFSSHGNTELELTRNQAPLNLSNIEDVLEAIIEPDNVVDVSQGQEKTLRFEKTNGDQNIAITVVSTKRGTLTLKTGWIINKKSGVHTPLSNANNALDTTLEAGSRNSTTSSIPETSENVNTFGDYILGTEEIDTYARENISDYKNLSAPNQSMIRKVIRDGRARGVAEDFILTCARISAHSGLNIEFNKERLFIAENGIYADGAIDLKRNRIIINPEAKSRNGESILIHELTHAIYNSKDGVLTVAEGVETMSEEEKKSIRKRYSKAGQSNSLVYADEINAHFAEQTLANHDILERLVSEKPTIKEKILSFLRRAKSDYAEDTRLTGAADKLYRQYRKLFDEFSARNFQANAFDKGVTNINQENMHDTGIKFAVPLEEYPYSMQSVIKEYLESVDARIMSLIDYRYNEGNSKFKRIKISEVTQRQTQDIKKITDLDVTGYSHAIATNCIEHIYERHGKNGKADHSMANDSDIARITYVLEHYDGVELLRDQNGNLVYNSEFKNSDNTHSLVIKYHKKINGTFYVVEAVPDSGNKLLHTISAYITKKGPNSGVLSTENESPAGMFHPYSSPTNSILQTNENVNTSGENSSSDGVRYALSEGRGRGYIGRSMSVNAANAYAIGEMPITKWDKSTIIEAIKNESYNAELIDSLHLERLTIEELRNNFLTQTSWHHTGAHYNATDFYSIDENKVENISLDEVEKIISNRKKRTRTSKTADEIEVAQRNKIALEEARHIDYMIDVIFNSNITGLKTKRGILARYLSNSMDIQAKYNEALEFYRRNDANKISLWQRLPDEHWRHEYVNLFETDIEAYVKKVYGFNEKGNNNFIQAIKKKLLERNEFSGRNDTFANETQDSTGSIRHALPIDNSNQYSYDTLTSKPDMVITELRDDVPRDSSGKVIRARVRAKALANVRALNNPKNTAEFVYAHCDDANTDIRVGSRGLNHGLDRRVDINARASLIVGDLIKNAIKVNEVNSLSQGHEGDYVLLSSFSDKTSVYGVSIYVDRVSNEVTGMDSIDILYSLNGKKIGTAAPNAEVSDRSPSPTVPTISISQLLELCNTQFKDIFSKDVYAHFGTTKDTTTKLGSTTRYALSSEEDIEALFADLARGNNGNAEFDFNAILERGIPRVPGASSLSIGELKKVIANNTHLRVYSKKTALGIIGKMYRANELSNKTRLELADALWQGLNDCTDIESRRTFAHDMAEFIVAKLITEVKTQKYCQKMAGNTEK